MKTSQQPTSQSGADEWTCSLAAFRASLSVMPGDAEARRMTATSGRQCIAPSTKSSPLGLWLRTLLESSRWSSRARFLRWQVQPLFSTRLTTFEDDTNCERPLPFNASAQTLKVTDMPSSRCLFRLVPSEPPTDETGCSSSQGVWLPTPNTYDYNTTQDEESKQRTLERRAEEGKTCYPSRFNALRQLAREERLPMPKHDILPTPTAIEGVKWTNTWNPNSQMGQSLSAMAGSGMLPTPFDWKLNGGMLPTPRTMEVVEKPEAQANRLKDRTGNQMNNIQSAAAFGMLDPMTPDSLKTDSQGNNAGQTSRLSPLFTEEMMGFPLMWTALPFLSESGEQKPSKPTATPSSPKSCTKSSEPSSKSRTAGKPPPRFQPIYEPLANNLQAIGKQLANYWQAVAKPLTNVEDRHDSA